MSENDGVYFFSEFEVKHIVSQLAYLERIKEKLGLDFSYNFANNINEAIYKSTKYNFAFELGDNTLLIKIDELLKSNKFTFYQYIQSIIWEHKGHDPVLLYCLDFCKSAKKNGFLNGDEYREMSELILERWGL